MYAIGPSQTLPEHHYEALFSPMRINKKGAVLVGVTYDSRGAGVVRIWPGPACGRLEERCDAGGRQDYISNKPFAPSGKQTKVFFRDGKTVSTLKENTDLLEYFHIGLI